MTKNKKISIYIFLNGNISKFDDYYYLERSLDLLSEPLKERGYNPIIVSEVMENILFSGRGKVHTSEINIHELAKYFNNSSKLIRFFQYIKIIFRITSAVRLADYIYIFLPGNHGFLASIICIIFRRRFGIYLRGSINYDLFLPFKKIIPLILKNSEFLLYTAHLPKHLKVIKSEAVVPMSVLLKTTPSYYKNKNKKNSINILCVTQIIEKKGIFQLLNAFKLLLEISPPYVINLYYVGEGSEKVELNNRIANLNLHNNVCVMGGISDIDRLREIYLQSDIFCLPTEYPEGFPRVLYEAMHFGIPIITTNAGCISEVLTNNVDSIILNDPSAFHIFNALLSIIKNPSLSEMLSSNAHDKYLRLKTIWEDMRHGDQVANNIESSKCVE
jgi:glycosyltransferase involved in cell wall biosynthesis